MDNRMAREPMRLCLLAAALLSLAMLACTQPQTTAGGPGTAADHPPVGAGSQPGVPSAAPEQPVTIHVAGAGISGNLMTPWATYEAGYFKKYNLDVDGVPDIAASTTAVQAVIARDIDVLNITPNGAIAASPKGGT